MNTDETSEEKILIKKKYTYIGLYERVYKLQGKPLIFIFLSYS